MNKYLLLFLGILLISSISAMQTFKQGDVLDMKVQCIINGTYCSNTATCNINILYQNNTPIVINGTMDNQGSYFNYTIPSSSLLGTYKCSTTCCQGGLCGTTPSGDPTSCDFEITPSGLESSTANALYYFGALLIFFILFIGSVYLIFVVSKPWMKLLFVSVSYLLFIALTFISWQISVNFITTIPFIQSILYFIWFIGLILFLPFIFVSGLWLLDMMSKEADVKKKVGMGYTEDEARNGYK